MSCVPLRAVATDGGFIIFSLIPVVYSCLFEFQGLPFIVHANFWWWLLMHMHFHYFLPSFPFLSSFFSPSLTYCVAIPRSFGVKGSHLRWLLSQPSWDDLLAEVFVRSLIGDLCMRKGVKVYQVLLSKGWNPWDPKVIIQLLTQAHLSAGGKPWLPEPIIQLLTTLPSIRWHKPMRDRIYHPSAAPCQKVTFGWKNYIRRYDFLLIYCYSCNATTTSRSESDQHR